MYARGLLLAISKQILKMSRVIIKNLPKNATEAQLRSLFGTKGHITDLQLKYTKDGEFRRFGFIGYETEEAADAAIEYFHESRVNTTKITVQKCASLGDESKPQSWSKYAVDSSSFKKLHKTETEPDEEDTQKKKKKEKDKPKTNEATKELVLKYKDDPMFDQFLDVHSATKIKEILQEDDEDSDSGKAESCPGSGVDMEDTDKLLEKLANKEISDDEYLKLLKAKLPRKKAEKKTKVKVDLYTVKLTNLPYGTKKKDIKDFLRPTTAFSIRIPRQIKGIAFVGFKDEKKYKNALNKNKSILNGKQVYVNKYEKKATEDQSNETNPKWKLQEDALKNEEDIAESGRIFVRNLAYTTTEDDIQKHFEKYGPVAEISLPIDPITRQMKGFGVVTFLMPEHAVRAYSELDGKILQGRMLHLLPGKQKDNPDDGDDDNTTDFKKKKEKQRKAQAGSSHNWNSLFLGHDAVAEVVANTYNTTKEAVLDPHGSGSAAVRLALGETQIVATTRKYLEEHGVYLDAFNSTDVKRSKTIILVKNLPANTKYSEIRDVFQEHGVIGRIIFPPSGITAIVEFVEPSEAKKAFSKLAYKRFKHLPLYLEWAPENVINKDAPKPKHIDEEPKQENVSIAAKKEAPIVNKVPEVQVQEEVAEEEENDEPEPEADTTLFVKNLDFNVTDKQLYKHFERCGQINYATVAAKKDPYDPKNKISMGYGFVRFVFKSDADKALKELQFSNLLGKSLELKRSERTLGNDVKTSKKKSKLTKQTGTKILVKNIPFQANQREVTELFKTFGEIKSVRLPKKMTPGTDSHRGFGFVDFTTASDAKKCFEALSQSTHLYGRRLILEWAQPESDVSEIRKRTADHFHEEEVVKSKKSVFEMDASI